MRTKKKINKYQRILFLLFIFTFLINEPAAAAFNTAFTAGWLIPENGRNLKTANMEASSYDSSGTLLKDLAINENKISRIEYFFDYDPGFGKGISVEFNPGSEVILNKTIPVNSLNEGIHIFYLRVRDEVGRWSQTLNQIFLKTSLPEDEPYNISKIEYFFDDDPGYGNGISAEFSKNPIVILDKNWSINALSEGIHILYVRVLDASGQWSQTYNSVFLKTRLQTDEMHNISEVEYFFDIDPGVGKGTKLVIAPGNNPEVDQIIPVDGLTSGLHKLYVRCKDVNNKWSQLYQSLFYKYTAHDVVKAEYYFDTDPGPGKGTDLPISPSEIVVIDEILKLQSLSAGNHTFNVRAMSGNNLWSDVYSYTVTVFIETSIDDNQNEKAFVIAYPNPAKEMLNIDINTISSPLEIQITSANGKVLFTKVFSVEGQIALDMSQHAGGVYFLRIKYKDKVKTQNVILVK